MRSRAKCKQNVMCSMDGCDLEMTMSEMQHAHAMGGFECDRQVRHGRSSRVVLLWSDRKRDDAIGCVIRCTVEVTSV